jgi:two-component system response regulator (stage 0 sporulation protein F)
MPAVSRVPFAPPPLRAPLRNVLFIDEKVDDLYSYVQALKREGYNVRACPSCAEGTLCLESGTFDLVIVNQGSRNFEWRSLVERAIEIDRRRPVLVVTECVDMRSYLDAMWLGATDYLEKARSPEQLLKTVRMLLPPVAQVSTDHC